MRFDHLRQQFPITNRTPRLIYLNHAGVSPLCIPVIAAMEAHLREVSESGALNFSQWLRHLEETRRLAAKLVGGNADEIAFVPNTTGGIALVADGVAWKPGDNVIVSRVGYPAVVYPFRTLAERGLVELRWVDDPDGRILPDAVIALCDERTRAVALSLVEYSSGFRLDVESLGPRLAERGIRFIVDAIQGLGVTPVDVRRARIDVLAAGGFKWLLGPQGTGLLWIRRELLDEIRPVSVGAGSVVHPGDYLDLTQPLARTARRFEGGTYNFAGLSGFHVALRLIVEELGVDAIRERIFGWLDGAVAELCRRGYEIRSPIAREAERSGILCFTHPRHSPAEIERRASERGVHLVVRRNAARIAPHAYNDEEDLACLLAAIP